jgi:hypothetical protein
VGRAPILPSLARRIQAAKDAAGQAAERDLREMLEGMDMPSHKIDMLIEKAKQVGQMAAAESTISDLQQRVSELERVGDRMEAGYRVARRELGRKDGRPEESPALAEWRRLRAGGET